MLHLKIKILSATGEKIAVTELQLCLKQVTQDQLFSNTLAQRCNQASRRKCDCIHTLYTAMCSVRPGVQVTLGEKNAGLSAICSVFV